jgi:hypothetical protein
LALDPSHLIADDVVHRLQQHGDPWNLSEEAKPKSGPTT